MTAKITKQGVRQLGYSKGNRIDVPEAVSCSRHDWANQSDEYGIRWRECRRCLATEDTTALRTRR